MSETKIKAPKELIAEGAVTGGLVQAGTRQHYRINYMLPMKEGLVEYDPKLEVAILIIKETEGEPVQSYRSLRFTNSAQIRGFILNMIKAYTYWQKKNGELRPDNIDFKLSRMLNDVNDAYRHQGAFK